MEPAAVIEECPYCKRGIADGASVCTGCQAERRTGPSKKESETFATVGIILAGAVGFFLLQLPLLWELGVALGGGVAGTILAQSVFAGPRWIRLSKTAHLFQ